jgi:glucose/arabinose dehydrogenase
MRFSRTILVAAAAALLAASCGPIATPVIGPGTTEPLATTSTQSPVAPDRPLQALKLTLLTSGLESPVAAATAPGDDRLFVAEKAGKIMIVDEGTIEPTPFLDITDKVDDEWSEQGLVGLVFHPRYESNGRVFVYYTRPDWSTALVEYRVADDGNHLDPDTARTLLELDQPHPAHNGADLQFGPDGYLYVTLGDGGINFQDNAQDPYDLHGSILRLDVDAAYPYAIPPDNPFADGTDGAPEVWVYGLRNPWRFWIDSPERRVYIADVGFERWEEIDVVDLDTAGGSNFGWPVVEGPICFEGDTCDRSGFVEPILTLEHVRLCAIIGGPVYRGPAIPELNGHFFYADYCVGWIRSLEYQNGAIVEEADWSGDFGQPGQITSLALDPRGEILVLVQTGELYRIEPVR